MFAEGFSVADRRSSCRSRLTAARRIVGFWHTGYMEFHEHTEEGSGGFIDERKISVFPCATCGIEFITERDFRVHTFQGHAIQRPVLVFKGRECGRGRLFVTEETSVSDWVIRDTDKVTVNGSPMSLESAAEVLCSKRSGVVEVTLAQNGASRPLCFEFEFNLAEEADLLLVDEALDRLIDGRELSARSIDDFIMRSRHYPTSVRYVAGLANYLYGVIGRERAAEAGILDESPDGGGYQGKYDQAVEILRNFDRPPAEAICGIVAFHYNQFERAMTKTKSQRVADVSLRFQSLLTGQPIALGDLSLSPHSSLDRELSDSVMEQVLKWSAIPLDGTAAPDVVSELTSSIDTQRFSDAVKLHLVAAEHTFATGDVVSAKHHAEYLRHSRLTEGWAADFKTRDQFQGVSR